MCIKSDICNIYIILSFALSQDILFILLVAEGMLVTYAAPKEHTLTPMGRCVCVCMGGGGGGGEEIFT